MTFLNNKIASSVALQKQENAERFVSDQFERMTIFDITADSQNYEYKVYIDRLKEQLSKFGITANQSKVYMYLGKYGSKTAPQICKVLRIPRTETYHLLNSLQNRGIVSATFQNPIKFSALPLERVVWILVQTEKERIKTLANQKEEMVELWEKIPDFKSELYNKFDNEEKFQMLQGRNQINGRINEMIEKTKNEFIVLGLENDLMRFYHADFLSLLNEAEFNVKILADCSDKTMYIFDDCERLEIKKMPSSIKENLCFVLKDDNEMLLFMKNDNYTSKNTIAMWTESYAIISMARLLFGFIWSKSTKRIC